MLKARIEIVLAATLGVATILTVVWPTWIEGMFGLEPDGGSGATEWWIVAVLAVATLTAAAIARHDLRSRRPSPGTE